MNEHVLVAMNMTMLAEFLSDVMLPQLMPLPEVPEVTLDEHWLAFEETLGKYKATYAAALGEFRKKETRLLSLTADATVMQNASSVIGDQDLQTELIERVKTFNETNRVTELRDELAQLNGTIKAMEVVLMNTNARKYSQFTCSICMERLVDTFLDPCGHLACEQCLGRTRSPSSCPMCRTTVTGFKKMFPTMQ